MTDDTGGQPAGTRIHALTGVYDADGTLWGELSYVVGTRLGRRHCALCDITHGALREKASWRACRDRLPVPFHAVHLNERTPEVAAFTGTAVPCVVAHSDEGLVVVLDADALEGCHGDPERLAAALEAEAARRGLGWA